MYDSWVKKVSYIIGVNNWNSLDASPLKYGFVADDPVY